MPVLCAMHECIMCTTCGIMYLICCYYKYMYLLYCYTLRALSAVVAIVQCIDCIGGTARERALEAFACDMIIACHLLYSLEML